jgi:hypothetical protein
LSGADKSAKWETVRRLRYGALIKLFRHRWGYVLPDDDAGRGDLWELVTNVSLAVGAPEKKIAFIIETWEPWMQPDEAAAMVEHVKMLTIYERTPTAKQLGERVRLTNAERERLKLWPIKPIDANDDQIEEQRKARKRERLAQKRKANGIRTRTSYLAELTSKPRPWEAKGISRSTWYRRKRDGVCRQLGRGVSPTIVSKQVTHLVSPNMGQPPKEGIHGGGEIVRLRQTTEATEVEKLAPSSPHVVTDPVPPSSPDVHLIDPRIAALNNWGRIAEQISPELREHYLRLRERFDALTNPRLGAAA